jgi:hypothetical protein
MAESKSMTAMRGRHFLRKEEGGDFLRELLRSVVQQLNGGGMSRAARRRARRAQPGAADALQRSVDARWLTRPAPHESTHLTRASLRIPRNFPKRHAPPRVGTAITESRRDAALSVATQRAWRGRVRDPA